MAIIKALSKESSSCKRKIGKKAVHAISAVIFLGCLKFCGGYFAFKYENERPLSIAKKLLLENDVSYHKAAVDFLKGNKCILLKLPDDYKHLSALEAAFFGNESKEDCAKQEQAQTNVQALAQKYISPQVDLEKRLVIDNKYRVTIDNKPYFCAFEILSSAKYIPEIGIVYFPDNEILCRINKEDNTLFATISGVTDLVRLPDAVYFCQGDSIFKIANPKDSTFSANAVNNTINSSGYSNINNLVNNSVNSLVNNNFNNIVSNTIDNISNNSVNNNINNPVNNTVNNTVNNKDNYTVNNIANNPVNNNVNNPVNNIVNTQNNNLANKSNYQANNLKIETVVSGLKNPVLKKVFGTDFAVVPDFSPIILGPDSGYALRNSLTCAFAKLFEKRALPEIDKTTKIGYWHNALYVSNEDHVYIAQKSGDIREIRAGRFEDFYDFLVRDLDGDGIDELAIIGKSVHVYKGIMKLYDIEHYSCLYCFDENKANRWLNPNKLKEDAMKIMETKL